MKRPVFASFSAFLLISGCGGSGGGAPVVSPDPSLSITSNNAVAVSKTAYENSRDSQQYGDADGGIPFIASSQNFVAKIDTNLTALAKTGTAGSNVSQVPIPPETIPCAISGTQTISGNIADPITPALTAGDFFQTDYNACDDGLGDIQDGVVRIDINAFSGDLLSQLFSMTVTVTMTGFQVSIFENQSVTPTDVITSNGAVTVLLDGANLPFVSTSISGDSLVVDSNASSESLTNFASAFTVDGNLSPSPYTTSASGTLDSTQLAGIIRYSNPVIFNGLGGDYPSSGEFLVEGLDSSLLLIADNNVDVRILIDLGADGTIDETIVTTWAQLTAPTAP